jgi:hypothetical protein
MENTLIIELSLSNSDYFDNYDLSLLDFNTQVNVQAATFNDVKTLFPLSTGYEPKEKDKLFFAKSVNIPRVKLKNLTKDYKIKATTKIEEANAVFISSNTTAKYTDVFWRYSVRTDKFKEFFEAAVDAGYFDDYHANKIKDGLEFYEGELIAIDYNTRQILEDVHIPFRLTEGTSYSSQRLNYIADEYYDSYKDILDFTGDVYDESELLKYLNGSDAIAIEENMYESLCEMFDSSDRDNHTMAMEIMANSQFEESVLYLSLLFNKYYNDMQNSRTKSHVNFKSLLALMEIRSNYFYLSIDDIVIKLKKHNKLTKENVDLLLKKLGDDITDRGDSTYFKVKTITMTEDMLAVLNLNYEYRTQGDFTPLSPEIEEVVEETVSLEEEAVVATVEETVEEVVETVEEVVNVSTKEIIDFDNVIVESKTNNDDYFL